MFFWPTKFLCLTKQPYDHSQASWVCDTIGYRSYRPRNKRQDVDLIKSLRDLGVKYVPAVVDASGEVILNLGADFVTNFEGNTTLIEGLSHFPIFVAYNESSDSLALADQDLDPDDGEVKILCKTDPVWYTNGNTIAEVYRTTQEEFMDIDGIWYPFVKPGRVNFFGGLQCNHLDIEIPFSTRGLFKHNLTIFKNPEIW